MQSQARSIGRPSWTLITLAYLVVAGLVPGGLVKPLAADPSDRAIWTTMDVVDERIATDGQYSLIRMCRGLDTDATSMLTAILDDETLAGIYQVNFEVPALRARALSTNWWELIPHGQDGACVAGVGDSGEAAPMIVYRKDIGPYPEVVDAALRAAWQACRDQYGLPQRDPIPCSISSRQSQSFSACPEKMKLYTKIANDCAQRREIKAAVAECSPVCGKRSEHDGKIYIKYRSECVKTAAECQAVHEITATCREYAAKQVTCP